jgi:dTDP-4-dehydrorhamnose reductase
MAALAAHRPDAVINCAAYTRVDGAESDSDEAYRSNALGPRLLAAACTSTHTRLCHLSTDYVFDGTSNTPVDEWARPAPLGVYGASKLAGELEVRALCSDHVIVRTSWLYGQSGPNFVLTMLRLARESGVLRVVADQQGSPTWTGHIAPTLVDLLEQGHCGTFHLTNSGVTTWHGFAEAIVKDAGLSDIQVEAIATSDYPTAARRPMYSVLDNRAWRLLGGLPLPDWREGLRAYLREHNT